MFNSMVMNKCRRILSLVMAIALMVTCGATTAQASSVMPRAVDNGNKSITFSNLDALSVGESVEYEIIDKEGNPATIGIERVSAPNAKSGAIWKVYFTGVIINCHFYMNVTNDKVTSVYDEWVLIVGGTYDDLALTQTSTYGKLSFKLEAYAGIMASTCWLKGTVTGSNNDIIISHEM